MITSHSLAADAFADLAGGAGDSAVVRQLREAQLSKHLMLLHIVADAAAVVEPSSSGTAAFRAGYQLLAKAEAIHPGVVARLLGLPQVGGWAHDCITSLDNGSTPDFGYLAAVAAAAAVGLGVEFEIDVPACAGHVPLPGLGCLEAVGPGEWLRLISDGERLRVGDHVELACAALVPDDGSGETVRNWRGTPLVRAITDGQLWEVLLETADSHLDRYALPGRGAMSAAEVANWRKLIQDAWELLVRQHDGTARPVAEGVRVIVPLVSRSDLDSATSPAAFGAVATSLPPSPVSMAETLVHEFQHIKLSALLDMFPLIEPCADRGYAPWRDDPRPMGGILQGVYAFTGIVRFWDVQRRLEAPPDEVLKANVLYERWRLAIDLVSGTLLGNGSLTPTGIRFVSLLRQRGHFLEPASVPAEAIEIARDVALDNRLSWQLRHTALDEIGVAGLAAAYRDGEPLSSRALPGAWIKDDTREIDSVARSRLLNSRFQRPQWYRRLSDADLVDLGLSKADALLFRGNASAAVAAYRAALAVGPDPVAWIGLALAVQRLPANSAMRVLATHLPLLFEVHACLAGLGVHADPLDLAAWFK